MIRIILKILHFDAKSRKQGLEKKMHGKLKKIY